MTMKKLKIGAWLTALALVLAVAISITPASAETASNVIANGCALSTAYTDCDVYCPDATWTASGGGYYFDYPYPFADDIDIRATQRETSGSIPGWHVQAKWHTTISGQSRNIVVQVVCIR